MIERGEYLPGEPDVPATAREFWAYVDARCDDEDLGAASFLERVHRRHFYFGIADGVKADFVRFRQCDARLNAQGGRKTASAYDAIGAAQVAKASFSGMRFLHRLDGKVAIWPMDPLPSTAARWSRSTPASISAGRAIGNQGANPRRAQPRARPASAARPRGSGSSPTTTRPTLWSPPPGCASSRTTEPRAFDPHGLTPHIAAGRRLDLRRAIKHRRGSRLGPD